MDYMMCDVFLQNWKHIFKYMRVFVIAFFAISRMSLVDDFFVLILIRKILNHTVNNHFSLHQSMLFEMLSPYLNKALGRINSLKDC